MTELLLMCFKNFISLINMDHHSKAFYVLIKYLMKLQTKKERTLANTKADFIYSSSSTIT